MVSAKEDEILTLNGKLEEKNLRKFEEEELRERVNDLKVFIIYIYIFYFK